MNRNEQEQEQQFSQQQEQTICLLFEKISEFTRMNIIQGTFPIKGHYNNHKKMDEENQIPQMIMRDMEDSCMNFELMESENASIEIENSIVKFKKQGLEVGKHGAQMMNNPQENINAFYINPDFIQEEGEIGRGTAGFVLLANYNIDGLRYQVAIKQIPIDTKQSRDQFVNDLKVFLNSDNPNMVKFYGCFYREGWLNEVIEYMNLGSLKNIIKFNHKYKRPPMEEILAELALCVLKGLLYIHKEKHQIHRDIKPENILINSNGEVKITDFGIFKQLQKTYELSKTWCGTHIYMSPERVLCKEYSMNSDVWSFGLTLFELATLRPIHLRKTDKKESEYSIIQRIKNDPPPSFLPEDNRSPEFCDFLGRCLEKDYHKRAYVQELLQHPWIGKNAGKVNLREFMQLIEKDMKRKKG